MSPDDLEFRPEAVAEARAARDWYAERSAAAAEAFVVELDHAIEFIAASPDRWPTYFTEQDVTFCGAFRTVSSIVRRLES